MKIRVSEPDKPRVEIIPMIDTIFFLLVFFMFSSLSMVHMKGMGLAMPKDSPGHSRAPKQIVLAVSPQGQYYLNAHPLSPAALSGTLKAQLATRPDATVVVNVAPSQKTDTLVTTMDIVNEVLTQAGSKAPILIATPPVAAEKTDVQKSHHIR